MAQAHEQDRSAPAKQPLSNKQRTARLPALSRTVRIHAGEETTEVTVSKVRYKRIATNGRVLGKVITGYADTAAKAKRTGRTCSFTFTVTPDGEAKVVAEETDDDPLGAALARARARGTSKVATILNSADMLTARDFGSLIGASHETVNVKRRRHELLGLEGATRGVRYPRWQITDAGLPLPGLPKLFEALGEQPWTVYRFLRTAHPELGGGTALDALRAGQVDAVVEVARNQAASTFT